eukprot:CAMPEP_0201881730 /NCGR_PEP_ID=MMETSP0902-20130614/11940_1 /ASSEMBLY_ACC=CAM_ASM_000551 /TAXON_ID=420261 /ORGANISM="Thalassiosira antarctica, Strain CCMP982" /LENGTH=414 /DNA_ID=CAMNT_0048409993 /DNA_START=48 /DNA_END=1292 /DNA_ORIENTATION=-
MKAVGFLILAAASINTVAGFQLSTSKRITTTTVPTQLTMTSTTENPPSNADHTLYDLPVSNNGARCRIILYKKNISTKQVEIISPMTLGGLKSEEYLKKSPQGLMPCLSIQKKDNPYGITSLAESDTIARYLLSEYSTLSPSFLPDHPKSNQICRWHDMYLTTIQGCLYKPASRFPIGDYADRKSAIAAYRKNLNIIESFLGEEESNYLCGEEVSLADAALFPSAVFAAYILPKFDEDLENPQPALPPRLRKWFDNLRKNDEVFSKVYDEIMDPLVHSWEETNHRWDTIWLAGLRDTAPGTLFDKIIAGDIPASIVKEDDHILAFKDITPLAPAHILVIPKDRNGLTNLRQATAEHTDILGRLLVAAGEIAKDTSLGFGDGARIVINDGEDGGQEVHHLHVHVLGGRKMEATFG